MSYKIIGKYIKDLDFQIPNPKVFFSLSKDISNYKINIDIKSNQIKQNIIEVLTSLNLKSKKESIDKINTKIVLATIIEMDSQKIEKTEIDGQLSSKLNLKVVELSDNEVKEHEEYLLRMKEETGTDPIGLNKNV